MSRSDDPFDAWRKRFGPGAFPADFFAEFEKEFTRMRGMMERIMDDAMKHAQSPQRGEPFVYGFSMRVGADGVPVIQPFGNKATPAGPDLGDGSPSITEGREPMTDVVESDHEVAVTAELPGVEKRDISLHVGEEVVTIRVDKGRKYHKQIRLPGKVDTSSAKATYKNGVLDVVLRRVGGRNDEGHKVSID